jgi:hypothetical protein
VCVQAVVNTIMNMCELLSASEDCLCSVNSVVEHSCMVATRLNQVAEGSVTDHW